MAKQENPLSLDFYLRNSEENGWPFNSGDPEFWLYQDRLVAPGGQALDLGTGCGRTSIFFALSGMEVTGYETDPNYVRWVNELARENDLSINVRHKDVNRARLGKNRYDTVVIAQLFVHWPSRENAFQVMEKAYDALKPGGHLWLRVPGKDDDSYRDLAFKAECYPELGYKELEPGVFLHDCQCSPDEMVPTIFFDPTEVLGFFTARNAAIVHWQAMPEEGHLNIRFGEDWQQARWGKNCMLSLLAQKR